MSSATAEVPATASDKTSVKPAAAPRLMSLDALRGFDMLWIIGGAELLFALEQMNDSSVVRFLTGQLRHKDWEGFAFYDLIFPLFVFMAGVSIVFSLPRSLAEHGRGATIKRILWRTLLLILLGIFYSGGISNGWAQIRWSGVLQRIGVAYCGAALLFCFLKPRGMLLVCAGILIGYWALLTFVPVRDFSLEKSALQQRLAPQSAPNDAKKPVAPAPETVRAAFEATSERVSGKFENGHNLTNHLDFMYLPGRKIDTYYDNEGLFSMFPAIATCLLGVFAGLLLGSAAHTEQRKVTLLITLGAAGVVAGFLWGLQFPVIKKIWTSSYVLVAGGYSAILLGVFYLVVDVWKCQRWCQPFLWIGMNPITIYMVSNMLGGFGKLSARLVGGDIKTFFDSNVAKGFGSLVISLVSLGLALWFLNFLYRRKIFIRL